MMLGRAFSHVALRLNRHSTRMAGAGHGVSSSRRGTSRATDTVRAMSQESVESFKRAVDAYERRDLAAMKEECDPEIEWHSATTSALGGATGVYRGYAGIGELFRDHYEAFTEIHFEFSEIRDLGDRLVATGRIRVRGMNSGAEIESPLSSLTELRNDKALRVWTYLDATKALEAAGLAE